MNQKESILRTYFENEIRKSNGQSFEDLFVRIMREYDKDFIPVKAYGSIGDRKNDGFNSKTGTYYQIYAPASISNKATILKAVNKLENDFEGLLEHWNQICKVKTFNFVINNKFDAIPVPLTQKLVVLRNQYPEVRIDIFDSQMLWDIFCSLDVNTKKSIFPCLPEAVVLIDNVYTSENIQKHVNEIGNSIIDSSIKQVEICDDYLKILYPGIIAEPESNILVTLNEILEQVKDIQIIGPAGSGKTVLAFSTYKSLLSAGEKVIPLYLKTYGYDGQFNNYLYYQINQVYVRPVNVDTNAIETIKNLFANEKEYRYVIFVDGINETSSMLEGDLIKELNELASFESCQVVVLVRNEISSLKSFEKYYVNEVPEPIVHSRIHSYHNLPYETRRILRRPLLIEAYKEILDEEETSEKGEFTEADILFSFYKNKINKMGQAIYSVAKHEYVRYVSVVVFNYFAYFCWSISRTEQVVAEFNEDYFDIHWSNWSNTQGSSKRTTVRDSLGFNYITVLNDMNLIHHLRSDLYHEYYYIDQFIVDYYCSLYIANSLQLVDANLLFDIKQNESINRFIAGFCDKEQNNSLFVALKQNKGKNNDKIAETNKKIISCMKYCKISLVQHDFNELDLSLIDFIGEDWYGSTFVNSFLSKGNVFPETGIPLLPIVALNSDNVDQCVYMLEMGGYVYRYDLEKKEFVDRSVYEFERVEAYGLGVPDPSCIRIISNGIYEGRAILTVVEYSFLTKEKQEILTFDESRCWAFSNNGKWIVLDKEDSMVVLNINTGQVKTSFSNSMFENTVTNVTVTDDGKYLFVIDMFYNGYLVDLDNGQYVECYVPLLSKTVYVKNFGFVLFDANAGVHIFENSSNIMHSRCARIGRLENQLATLCFPAGDMSVMKKDNKLYAIWSQMLNSVVYVQEVGYETKMGTLHDKTGIAVNNDHLALSWDSTKVAFYSMDGYVRVYSIVDKKIENAYRQPNRTLVHQIRWSSNGRYLGVLSLDNITIYDTQGDTVEILKEDFSFFEFMESTKGWCILGYTQPNATFFENLNITSITKEEQADDMGTFVIYLSEDRYRKVFQDKDYVFDQLIKFENGSIGAVNWNSLNCTFIDFIGNSKPVIMKIHEEVAALKELIKSQAYFDQEVAVSCDRRGKMTVLKPGGKEQQIDDIQYGINILDCDFTGCKFDGVAPDDELIRKILSNGGKYNKH